jgi:curved DNA-binding protein CbpA
MESPHALLGLPASATSAEITAAYRKLVRRYPPELAPEKFARIHRAYELLASPARRFEAARIAPDEAIHHLFAIPKAALKPPPPPPPPLTEQDLEPVLGPFRRALLVKLLREAFHP